MNRKEEFLGLILILLCPLLFANAKDEADGHVDKANEILKETRGMSAGLKRDNMLQEAVAEFELALSLYNEHTNDNPEKAAALDSKLTQINSQMFWCNKLTTMAYYNAKESKEPKARPPVHKPAPKPAPKPEPRPVPKPAPAPRPVPVAKPEPQPAPKSVRPVIGKLDEVLAHSFLEQIAELARKRRFYKIRGICTRMIENPEPGIPSELPKSILAELEYVDAFLTSVFDKLMDPGDTPIVHYMMDGKKRTRMEFKGMQDGLVQMNIRESAAEDPVLMAIPLFEMDDSFFAKNTGRQDKKIIAGMGAFFLLETERTQARKYLEIAGKLEGQPADLKPLWDHLGVLTVTAHAAAKAADDRQRHKDLARHMKAAAGKYEKNDYEGAFKDVKRIMDKAKKDKVFLQPTSNQCSQLTEKDLAGFVKALMEECVKCRKKRKITCIKCKGIGRIKSVLGKGGYVICNICRGRLKITCPYCKGRINSKTGKKYIKILKSVLK
ncbi:hypothetical protein ACFL4W_02330 [Planctomycetota bacterium]